MKPLFHPAKEDIQLSSVLYALSDPTRLSIVQQILESGEQTCKELSIPVAKSTLSHHTKVLREAGILRTSPNGTLRILSIRKDDLESRLPGLLDAIMLSASRTKSFLAESE